MKNVKKFLGDLIKRATSRKFILTVAAALTFYANKQYTELAATVLAYLAVEGGADVVAAYSKFKFLLPAELRQKTELIQSGDLELDNTPKSIVPGL